MNTLKSLRAELAATLTGAGTTVKDHLPERLVPPLAVIAAGSPYVEPGDAYGSWTVRFTVILVCSQATNEVSTDELDSAVTAALVALDGDDWRVERVDQPTMLAHANTHFLSTTIDVAAPVSSVSDDEAGGP